MMITESMSGTEGEILQDSSQREIVSIFCHWIVSHNDLKVADVSQPPCPVQK